MTGQSRFPTMTNGRRRTPRRASPSPTDRGGDRLPRLPRRKEARGQRGAFASGAKSGSDWRSRLRRLPAALGQAWSGSRQTPQYGAAARRVASGRRADRRQMDRQSQSPAVRLHARSDEARQGDAIKRSDAMLETPPIGVLHSPAPASRTPSATRPESSALRSGSSRKTAQERR